MGSGIAKAEVRRGFPFAGRGIGFTPWRAFLLLLALVSSATLGTGRAQPLPRQSTALHFPIPLGIYERDGSLLAEVSAQNLRLKNRGISIRKLEMDVRPRRILVLLDVSGSMLGMGIDDSWTNAKLFLNEFLRQAPSKSAVGLCLFAERLEPVVALTEDIQEIQRRAESLPEFKERVRKASAGKYTRLWDAMQEAVTLHEDKLRFGDAVVVVSDGLDDSSIRTDRTSVLTMLAAKGIRTIYLDFSLPFEAGLEVTARTPRGATVGEYRERILVQPLQNEGVFYLDAWSEVPMDLRPRMNARAIQRAAEISHRVVSSFYRLELEFPGPLTKPWKLSLELLRGDGNKRWDVFLTYPRRMPPLV